MKNFPYNRYFKDLVLLFLLTLIVYWPLSANYLSLKNDALVQYLAYRYHLSEAVRHGYMPLWSPYLYTGFPIHADMQGEVWNPLVLFLSLLGNYDMTVLQWEVLIYLFLAAAGMYRLLKYLGLSRRTAICCGIAFMSCGYMTDSISVIPWIPSAAFIPFVFLYFLRSLKSLALSDALKFSLCLSLMFLCGYPSFFIFLNYILGFSFLAWSIQQVKEDKKAAAWKALSRLGLAYLLFLLLCSPAIVSYYQFLPYYSRGSGISYEKAAQNPLAPFSILTYLLPNAASKAGFLSTDLSMRNAYVGLFILFFFLISLKKLDPFKTVVLCFTIFSFLFSLGSVTPIQKLSYHLPLVNTFRHPGTIRIFTSLGIILLAAYPLDSFFKQEKSRTVQWFSYASLVLLSAMAVYFILTNTAGPGLVFSFSPAAIKEFLSTLSFQRFSLILCGMQIIFVAVFLLVSRQKKMSGDACAAVFIFNSVVFAWIALPFTVVSQYKTSDVNHYIHSFPKGYPLPGLRSSIESEISSDSATISLNGYHNFYNKKIVVQDHIITPTLNTDYYKFLEDSALRRELKDHPFVYVSKDSIAVQPADIELQKFTPNSLSFLVRTPVGGSLQLFQQFNPNWQAFVNGRPAPVQKSNIAFMRIDIPAGTSTVQWKYQPMKVYAAMAVSALSLLAIAFYFLIMRKPKSIYA